MTIGSSVGGLSVGGSRIGQDLNWEDEKRMCIDIDYENEVATTDLTSMIERGLVQGLEQGQGCG